MDKRELKGLLQSVAAGEVSVSDAEMQLKIAPFTDLGYAKIDNHRGIRQGASEVIYGEGKTSGQIAGIIHSMVDEGQSCVLITRLSAEAAAEVADLLEDVVTLDYRPQARIGIVGDVPTPDGNGRVLIAAAGTSDVPVAEEAALTAEVLGNDVVRLYDVGVSGIHRLLSHAEDIMDAQVIVAVAGMEGALPSVVAGMASCPVIAVPTSVGYGASFGGVAALLAMLNSCASGISVVNIDNGFGAGYQASMINHVSLPRDPAQA
ncbi:MAG: nickel pincer cofactor biosynthesis protein LarB [Raoultibacter sp.]